MRSGSNKGKAGAEFKILRTVLNPIKYFFKGIKIKNKLFIIQVFIICLLCGVSLALLRFLINEYNNLLYHEAAQVLNLSTSSIENSLKRIEYITFTVLSDSDIQEYAQKISQSHEEYERFRERRLLLNKLVALTSVDMNVDSAIFIDSTGEQVMGGKNPRSLDETVRDEIVASAAAQKGRLIFMLQEINKKNNLFCSRQVRATANLSLKPLGTLVLRVDFDRLMKQYMSTLPEYDLNLIVMSDGVPVYYPDDLRNDINLSEFKFKRGSGYEIITVDGSKYFITHTSSAYTGFQYINIIPYEDIFKMTMFMRNTVLVLFCALFLLAMFFSHRISRTLIKPIEVLSARMKRVENGEFELSQNEISLDAERMDEIGHLQKDFYIMIQRINMLTQEDHKKQIAIKDAEYKALQAQINPHFLYNTLESINWMAKINKQHSISTMVESLGYLLRSSISKKEHIISVREELKILENYLTIQKIRYEDRLECRIDVDSELMEYQVPKLTFQPIVENSVNYGLENMLETCVIEITSEIAEDSVRFTIEDNGPGIDKDMLERLISGQVKTKGLGIGLKNIDDRIKMIFGEKYGISVESEKGKGTRVIIKIPREVD